MPETAVSPVVNSEKTPAEGTPGESGVPDPFALDEASLVSLSPEQRAALDPILEGWKSKARSEIERTSKSARSELSPFQEKAETLEKLVQWAPFQAWWASQVKASSPGGAPPPTSSQMQDIASSQEWSQAVLEASNGEPAKLQSLQTKLFANMAAPIFQENRQKMAELNTKLEMQEMMKEHPDYSELDKIGLDKDNEGTSLLEHCLNWAESNGKPLEEGYQMARRWADSMGAQKKAEAMGIVQGKKESVTSGPSTASASGNVVYVDTLQEAVKKHMEAVLEGRKDVRYEVRPKGK